MDTAVNKKLDDFFAQFPSRKFKKGDIIIHANSEPSGIFYIEDGIARSYWISSQGTEITLNMYKPHAFLPMSWAIGDVPNVHFYEAMTQVKVKLAPKETVIAFLKEQPDILYDLLRRIYVGMEGLWTHVESLTAGSSYSKLVASLVILAKRFGKKQNNETVIELKMNENDIANYAGTSRETASRELQKLKKLELVSFEKSTIFVHDIHKLEGILLQ